ncbi:MAG: hypothetical protein U0414_19275 [Polyangiaceae bacterium]
MIDFSINAELELTDCSGELWINGIPIEGQQTRRPLFEVSVGVHHLLVPGTNTLELWVDVEGIPRDYLRPRDAPAREKAHAVGRLVRYPAGVMANPDNGQVLAEIEYRGKFDDSKQAPRVVHGAVDLGAAFGAWSWQSAPLISPQKAAGTFELDDATRREAESLLEDVHTALFSGDADRMLELVKVRWEEMDRAWPGRNDAEDRARHAAFLSRVAADPRKRVPLNRVKHDFRIVGNGRLLECIDVDFMPSIRIAQEVEPDRWALAPYAVTMARVGPNGRLAVVR